MSTCFIQLMICYLLINDIFSLSPSTNILEIKRVVQCEQKTQQQNSLFLNSDQRSLEDCLDLESLLDDSESLLGDVSSEEEPEDLFLENILEETALKFLETTPYDKTSIETIMNENLEIDMDKLNQLPSPLKKQYTLLVTGQSFHEVGFKRIMKWGIPAVYVPPHS